MKFASIEADIEACSGVHSVGPIGLDTAVLCSQLRQWVDMWRRKYSDTLHGIAKVSVRTHCSFVILIVASPPACVQSKMFEYYDYLASASAKLQRSVSSMEDLRFVMDCLREVKSLDSGIDHELSPIVDMYNLLSAYLPDGSIGMVCWMRCVVVMPLTRNVFSRS